VVALGGGLLGLVAATGTAFTLYARRKTWRCEGCGGQLIELSEAEEDAHLDRGQQAEEEAGATNWSVRRCPACERIAVVDQARWFPSASRCDACGYRARTTTSQTIEAPTTFSTGLAYVTTACGSCGASITNTSILPMISTVTSSSPSSGSDSYGSSSSGSSGSTDTGSSGGSDFGGGDSGGGGAGSSW
jgi:uncharacterized protein